MTASVSVLCLILMRLEELNWEIFRQRYLCIIEGFLFSEFPFVKKLFVEEFYMFLITKGEEVFEEDELEELTEFLSNMEILEDSQSWLLFRRRWQEICKLQN